MKLKTLKDLNFSSLTREEIKAEAIKWYHRSDDNKHKFIREFFNITEDDLLVHNFATRDYSKGLKNSRYDNHKLNEEERAK